MRKQIDADGQIKKFCLYGFLKNLKFFEPYLMLFLMDKGLGLTEIGLLYGLREAVTYLFEVPSGMLADHYGKKKELLLCFVFYIVAFGFFFAAGGVWGLGVGMFFFGLGEAFRSGTHKAMILSYLEHRGWFEHKGYVYGRTRSYSLLGSSLSAFVSVALVLTVPALNWVFLASIVPYLLDFALILSYPGYLDAPRQTDKHFKTFLAESVGAFKRIRRQGALGSILMSSAIYDAVFRTVKDYIQPILEMVMLSAGIGLLFNASDGELLKVSLGVLYGTFYIFSAVVSRNVYRVTGRYESKVVFDKLFVLMGAVCAVIGFSILKGWTAVIVAAYFALYLMKDARRAVFVDHVGDYMTKSERVTVLSLESQLRALFAIVFAPVFGWLAETFSVAVLFGVIAVGVLVASRPLRFKNKTTTKK